MFFVTTRTKAQFYNNSQLTFLVRKECVDIIFKVQRGLYLTVNVSAISRGRLLLACCWDNFFNRLRNIKKNNSVLAELKKSCPLTYSIFEITDNPHFAFVDKELKSGAIVLEMAAPVLTDNISDYLHAKVVEESMSLMKFNLNLLVEIEENCPFSQWRKDLHQIRNKNN